jgi:hypothetical protein
MVFVIGRPQFSYILQATHAIGNTSVTMDYTDRRKYQRISVVRAIFIEVVSRNSRSESENMVLRCETVDVSVNGLKIFVTQLVAKGSKLNIAVPMEDWKENLELVGEAVWVKPAEAGVGFWVGLELRDSNLEDMRKWFKVVHSLSSTPPDQPPGVTNDRLVL